MDELTAGKLRHYQQLWPRIEALVMAHATVWLTACAGVLRDRIYAASRFDERTAQEKIMVDKFLGRTERYNELILGAVQRLGLASIDTSAASSASETVKQCLQVIG